MALFRSKQSGDIDTVRAKLDAARLAVDVAEQNLRDRALETALSDDRFLAEPEREELAHARARVELLEHAVVEAERLERQRIAALQAAQRETNIRAVRQHIRRMGELAVTAEVAIAKYTDAFRKMVETGRAIQKLMPHDSGLKGHVSFRGLTERFIVELNRAGGAMPTTNEIPAPHATYPIGFNRATEPPLSEGLKAVLTRIFDIETGRAAPPVEPVTAPAPKPPPPISPPATDAAEPPTDEPISAAEPPTVEERTNVSPPLSDDPELHAAFLAARSRALRGEARTIEEEPTHA